MTSSPDPTDKLLICNLSQWPTFPTTVLNLLRISCIPESTVVCDHIVFTVLVVVRITSRHLQRIAGR